MHVLGEKLEKLEKTTTLADCCIDYGLEEVANDHNSEDPSLTL